MARIDSIMGPLSVDTYHELERCPTDCIYLSWTLNPGLLSDRRCSRPPQLFGSTRMHTMYKTLECTRMGPDLFMWRQSDAGTT